MKISSEQEEANRKIINEIQKRHQEEDTLNKETTIRTNPYRDQVIEEVAQHLEKISPSVAGYTAMYIRKTLANYIREMKQ